MPLLLVFIAIFANALIAIPLGVRRDSVSWRSRDFWT